MIFKDKGNPHVLRGYLVGPLSLNGKTIGVAAIESDATNNFFNASQNYEGLGQTGEFYVAKKDKNGNALLISSLRFLSDAPYFKVSKNDVNMPIIQATMLKNEKIFTDTLDYRGQPVLAATRFLDSAGWGIVIKIDKTEAFASLDNLKYSIIFAVTIISILIIISSITIGRSISNPIIKLRNKTNEISNGSLETNPMDFNNLNVSNYHNNNNERNGNHNSDEISDLAY